MEVALVVEMVIVVVDIVVLIAVDAASMILNRKSLM